MLRRLILPLFALASVFGSAQTAPSFTWDQLKAVYDVQPLSDDLVKTQDRTAPEGTYTEFNFPSEGKDTAYGTFIRPNGKGPFPLVVLVHGLTSNREEMLKPLAGGFLKNGYAVLAIDAPHHGDRATADDKALFQKMIFGFAGRKDQSQGLGEYMAQNDPDGKFAALVKDAIEEGTRDIRRSIDWACVPGHRVDAHHIGVLGVSLGSIMASILSGVDDRIDADVLVIGGDPIQPSIAILPPTMQLDATATSSSLFLGHSTAHVLMLNGYHDQVMPKADTYRLYESAPGATLVFYDIPGDLANRLGHGIPDDGFAFGEEWLEKMINVPKPDARAHAKMGGGS